ncbi:MAG: hypothetical protein U0235_26850 [Polyangiaceae bacterium]
MIASRCAIRWVAPLALLAQLAACRSEPLRDTPAPAASASARSPRATLTAASASAMREAAWAPPPDAPPEFTGTLTVERVLSGPSLLTRPEGEPKVMPRLVGTLGKPTKVTTGAHMLVGKEQKHYAWAAKSGTTCAVFFVVEQPNMVAGWPSSLAADSGSGQFVMPKAVPNHEGKGDADLLREWEKYAACVDVLGEKLGFPPDAPARSPRARS